jgi:superfamily II DNA or RNA helicase
MASKHSQAPYLISQGIFDSIKSFKEFEQKVSALFKMNTKAQGDAFEIFVEAYLLTQPITQCSETWLVGSIPVEIRDKLNLPNDSKGIDGVFKSTSDVLVPYQVKFRSNRPALGFNEVAPFLGITEKAVDRLLITNCDSIAIDVKNRTGIRSLRGVDFDQLTEDDFLVIENWLKAKPAKRAALVPDPYQIEALSNISNHLESQDRGSVVMACGTGKTLVALWAVEQSKAKSILVLLPSLTLLQQTLSEWSVHNSWGKDFSYLCVCSDPQVDLKNDEIELDITDVPFKIDTDPEIVKRYLAQDNGKIKIIFSTYQSSQVVGEATKEGYTFEIGVFDEAHKTTGVSEGRFALALKDENISIKKRLFFTATPKHYDIRKRNKDGEFKFFSMDDESVYGSRAHTLSFSQAAEQGIICPYKVVVTLIDKQQVDDFALKNGITLIEGDAVKAKWVASQVAVSSAIKHTNAKKIITFHSRVKTASDFASDEIYGIKKFLPNFDVFHVHGKQRSNERKDTISKFKSSPSSLITNAKCLTEGVDVPAVDMVAFVDPRHSKIDIAQAVGRAMRKPRGGNKQLGYIVVPLYAEDTNEQSLETAIQNEGFDDVALIINSLLEQDSELNEIVSELKQAKGRGEVFNPERFKEKIEVIGPFINLEQLQISIFAETVDRLGSNWDEWYGRLAAFHAHEGHCKVPINYCVYEYKLGVWVSSQRANKVNLSVERIKRLNDLGFIWDALTEQWEEGFSHLVKFQLLTGHCKVAQNFMAENYRLGNWVSSQRANKVNLSEERIKRLNDLGFIWDAIAEQWEEGFSYLIKFRELEGHCNVTQSFMYGSYKLGNWIGKQRRDKDNLSDERKKRLNDLGFIWDPLFEKWEEGFSHLVKFQLLKGHCNVSQDFIAENYRLGNWVGTQRRNKDTLSSERLKRLTDLGFILDPIFEQWEEGFSHLVNFHKLEGHCKVSQSYVIDGFNLGTWMGTQRINENNLSDERKKRLNDLGFIWDPLFERWEEGFWYLVKFHELEGHCKVPVNFCLDNYKLGNWVKTQRKEKDKLSNERKKRLNDLGFTWDSLSEKWEEGFSHLVRFRELEGHCKVPYGYVSGTYKLSIWVRTQRGNKDYLSDERKKRLDDLGFIWDHYYDQWQEGLSHLVKFRELQGHCKVAQSFIDGTFKLGFWVDTQRRNKEALSPEQLKKLNDLGFIWDPLFEKWEEGFSHLVKFRELQGHCKVALTFIDGTYKLGFWVDTQRRNKDALSDERKKRLNDLGFIWVAVK